MSWISKKPYLSDFKDHTPLCLLLHLLSERFNFINDIFILIMIMIAMKGNGVVFHIGVKCTFCSLRTGIVRRKTQEKNPAAFLSWKPKRKLNTMYTEE